MNLRALIPVIFFVFMLIAAIIVGNWIISGMIGIPLDKAPFYLKAFVHGICLGGVMYGATKYFGTKLS